MEQNQVQERKCQASDEERKKIFKLLVAGSSDIGTRLDAIKVLPEADRQNELESLLKKAVENGSWNLVHQIVNLYMPCDRRPAVVENTLKRLFDEQAPSHAINFAARVKRQFTDDENKRLLVMFLEQGKYGDVCVLLRQVALPTAEQVEIVGKMVDAEAGLSVLYVARELKLDEKLIRGWAEKYLTRALAEGFFCQSARDLAEEFLQRGLTRKEYAILRKELVKSGRVEELFQVAEQSRVSIRRSEARRLFAGKLRQWNFIDAVGLIARLPESERQPARERALKKCLQAGMPEDAQYIAKEVLQRELSVAEIEFLLKAQFRRHFWCDQIFLTIKLLPLDRQMPWLMKLLRRGIFRGYSVNRDSKSYILSLSW